MGKEAGIEKILESKLQDVTAADFLEALNQQGMAIVTKDKRAEYWAEPERVPVRISIEELFERWRNRKKWVEREKFPISERYIDASELVRRPEELNQIADAVAAKLKGVGGGIVVDG
jgi:hypothetical protein